MDERISKIIKEAQDLALEKEMVRERIDSYKNMLTVAENTLAIIESKIIIENAEYENNKILYPGDKDLDENHKKAIEDLEKEKAQAFPDISIDGGENLSPKEKLEKLRAEIETVLSDMDLRINAALDSLREDPEIAGLVDEKILKSYEEEVAKKKEKRKKLLKRKERFDEFIAIINGNMALKTAFAKIKILNNDTEKAREEHKKIKEKIDSKEKRLEQLASRKDYLSDSEKEEYGKLEEEIKELKANQKEKYNQIKKNTIEENEQVKIIGEEASKENSDLTKEETWELVKKFTEEKDLTVNHRGEVDINPQLTLELNTVNRELEIDQKVVDRMKNSIENRKKANEKAKEEENKTPKEENKEKTEKKEQTPEQNNAELPAVVKLNIFKRFLNWLASTFGFDAPFKAGVTQQISSQMPNVAEKVRSGKSEQEIMQEMVNENTSRTQNVEPVRSTPREQNHPEPQTNTEPEHDADVPVEEEDIIDALFRDAEEADKQMEASKNKNTSRTQNVEPVVEEPTEEIDLGELLKAAKSPADDLENVNKKEPERPTIKKETRKSVFIDVEDLRKGTTENKDNLDIPDWANRKRNDDDDFDP